VSAKKPTPEPKEPTPQPYMFVEFSRAKKDQSFSRFRAASSLESLKQASKLPDDDDDDPDKLDSEEPESRIAKLCSEFIDRFEADLSRYHHLISIVTLIGGSMAIGAIDGYVLPEAKKHGAKVHSDELTEVYGLNENGFDIVIAQVRRANEINAGLDVLPSSALLSLVATFDSLTGDFVTEILKAEPKKVKFSDKTITYRDLFQNGDISKILNDAISSEVSQLLRGSHQEQLVYIEALIDTKISGHYDRLPNYLEIFERRNQFAHAAGLITDHYIEKCKSIRYPTDDLKRGDQISLNLKYLHRAVDYLTEFGILMSFMAWMKLGNEESNPFSKLNSVCFELIVKKRYKLAGYLLDFALHKQKCDANDSTKRMMQVNLANTYALLGKKEQARKTLDELDWSACSDDFKICVAAVSGDIESVCRILPNAVASNAISKSALRSWPVFEHVKDSKDFVAKFEDVFLEPYQIEMIPGNLVETAESSVDENKDLDISRLVH
jgi:hypothetical protein